MLYVEGMEERNGHQCIVQEDVMFLSGQSGNYEFRVMWASDAVINTIMSSSDQWLVVGRDPYTIQGL